MEDLKIPIEVVEKVVSDQFKQINRAFSEYDEIEVSGFGKFLQSQTKIGNRVMKYTKILEAFERRLREASTQEDVVKYTRYTEEIANKLSFYKSKLKPKDETEGYRKWMEKSSNSSGEIERGDKESERGETSDMSSLSPQLNK